MTRPGSYRILYDGHARYKPVPFFRALIRRRTLVRSIRRTAKAGAVDAAHLPARQRVALWPGPRSAPFAFVLLWSSSFIASRAGLRYLSPLLFVAVRMVIAAAALIAVMTLLNRSWRVLSGRWGHLAVSGVLTNSLLLMTAHYAMVHTGAAQIALVQTLNPLLTALLAWPVLGERLRPLQWLGLLLGATGVVLIVGLAALRSPVELARVCC